MLFGLLYNYWTFFILFSIIHIGCWIEYQKIIALIDEGYNNISFTHSILIILCGAGFLMINTNEILHFGNFSLSEFGKWIVIGCFIYLPISEVLLSKKNNIRVLSLSFLGLAYLSFSLGLLIHLKSYDYQLKGSEVLVENGTNTILTMIAAIWINDTMAYIVGSLIGKTPFSKISPKKTWEGTIGGAILAVVTITTAYYFLVDRNSLTMVIGVSSIAAIFGTIGDLFESKLKRLANVKDSGTIMPGHGGFLDRFDSILFATPFVYLFITFLK